MIMSRATFNQKRIGSPFLKAYSVLSQKTGYGAHNHTVTIPAVIAGNLIVVQIYARFCDTAISNPTGFTTIYNEASTFGSGTLEAHPRHQLSYKVATGSEGGTSVSVTAYNNGVSGTNGTGPNGASHVRVYVISGGTYSSHFNSSGTSGTLVFPTVSGARFTTAFPFSISTGGAYANLTATSQGLPTIEVQDVLVSNILTTLSIKKRTTTNITGGSINYGGGAWRSIITITVERI